MEWKLHQRCNVHHLKEKAEHSLFFYVEAIIWSGIYFQSGMVNIFLLHIFSLVLSMYNVQQVYSILWGRHYSLAV